MRVEFAKWFKGNPDAIHFAECLWHAAQEWDDLEDEGKADTGRLCAWLAFGKEYHPFFHANAAVLRPALLMMHLQWKAANVLDRGTRADVDKSYMLRAGIYSVWHVMAWVIGGQDWADEIGPDIYRTYSETPDEIWREFNNA